MNEDEKNKVGAEPDTEPTNTGADKATEPRKTFDELLQDKEYQSAFDKKIAQSLQTAKAKWDEENRNKQAEADRLAKMDEDQKKDYQLQEALRRAENAEKKLGARDLESETLKQANDKGIPLELISTIDFEKETAETISKKLEVFERTSKSVREKAINEYSGEEPPKVGEKVNTTPKSRYEQFLEKNK